jgi:hypothetical protein
MLFLFNWLSLPLLQEMHARTRQTFGLEKMEKLLKYQRLHLPAVPLVCFLCVGT